MRHMNTASTCFPFYSGGDSCRICTSSKRCKAVLATHGFDIVARGIALLTAELPEGAYRPSDRVSELVTQLLEPPTTGETKEQAEFRLGVEQAIEDLDINDL